MEISSLLAKGLPAETQSASALAIEKRQLAWPKRGQAYLQIALASKKGMPTLLAHTKWQAINQWSLY